MMMVVPKKTSPKEAETAQQQRNWKAEKREGTFGIIILRIPGQRQAFKQQQRKGFISSSLEYTRVQEADNRDNEAGHCWPQNVGQFDSEIVP